MGCQYILLFAIDSLSQCFLHALPACYLSCHTPSCRAASLLAALADSPSIRHPCRFPVCLRRRPSLPYLCHPIAHAHAYRIQSPHLLAPPHHPTPSTSPHAIHSESPSRYCIGSTVSSHGSAMGGKCKHGMPVRSVSARLQMVLVGYARCRTVCPFPQVIGAADTRY